MSLHMNVHITTTIQLLHVLLTYVQSTPWSLLNSTVHCMSVTSFICALFHCIIHYIHVTLSVYVHCSIPQSTVCTISGNIYTVQMFKCTLLNSTVHCTSVTSFICTLFHCTVHCIHVTLSVYLHCSIPQSTVCTISDNIITVHTLHFSHNCSGL